MPRPSRAQYEMAYFMAYDPEPHKIMMAQRGLSKSLTSQILVVWFFLNDPNEHILVMSAGASRAVNYTQFVQKLVRLLPVTTNMTPRNNIERTSGQSFDIAGAMSSDSPSLYAAGAGNQVTGMRATRIIYDDIETAQVVESAVLSTKIDSYAMEAQNLLMSGYDWSLTCCTPHSMSSMYIDWIANGFKPMVIPSQYPINDTIYWGGLAPYIVERIKKDPTLIGQAIDERLDINFLESKKMRIGRSKYKLQYMIDTSESDDLKHPLKLADLIVMDVDIDEAPLKISHSSMPDNNLYIKHNGFKSDKLYGPSYVSDERQPYEMKILSIDPSGRGADSTGAAMIFSLNTRLFIKKITGLPGGYDDNTLMSIATMCRDYSIDVLLVESNFGDGAFVRLLDPYLRRISPLTEIDEIRVTGQKEIRIIEALEPMMNQHRIVLDKSALDDDYRQSRVHSFTEQATKITKQRGCLRHDDVLDATANGIIYMLDKMSDDEEFAIEKLMEERNRILMAKLTDITGQSLAMGRLNYGDIF